MIEGTNTPLHLPGLTIKGFRGIQRLELPTLGRVTLLAGKNGAGKTTVLDAVRIYAARGRQRTLSAVLEKHEEFAPAIACDGNEIDAPNPAALFYDRRISPNSIVEIGPAAGGTNERLTIGAVEADPALKTSVGGMLPDASPNERMFALRVRFAERDRVLPWLLVPENSGKYGAAACDGWNEFPTELACRSSGPGATDNDMAATLRDDTARTEDEESIVRILNIAFKEKVDRVAMAGGGAPGARTARRRAVVKLRGHAAPVPLKSLGSGAERLLELASALVASRHGFLLIDQAENSLHHALLYDLWSAILRGAEENDVQVFATTHSFDHVRALAYAAESTASRAMLFRLENDNVGHWGVAYRQSEMKIAADQGIEVR